MASAPAKMTPNDQAPLRPVRLGPASVDVERRPDELLRNLRRALAGFDAPAELGHFVEH